MKFKKPLSALVVSALLLGGASGALAASANLQLSLPTSEVPGGSHTQLTFTTDVPGFLTLTLNGPSGSITLLDREEVHTAGNMFDFVAADDSGSPLSVGAYTVSGELIDQFGEATGSVSGQLTIGIPLAQQTDDEKEEGPASAKGNASASKDTASSPSSSGSSAAPAKPSSSGKKEKVVEYVASSKTTLGEQGYEIGVGVSDTVDQADAGYWGLTANASDADIWAALTRTMVSVNVGESESAYIYNSTDNGKKIGSVSGLSQGLNLIEDLDDGWSVVEAYRNEDGAFVRGYIRTNKLKTYNVRTDYGMIIDKLTQSLYIFKDGKLFTTLAVSTGLYNERQPYNETRSGEFVIISRVGDFRSDNLVCGMGLRFNSGDLLHEVPHVKNADGTKNYKNCEPKLGSRASHGCVRVQRLKNADGINMTWVWNNIKVGTKLVIWEDFAGRQIEIPADETPLYYNPDGGSSYHSTANCKGVKDKYLPLTAFTYGELETGAFAKLTACAYCFPPRRRADIEEINRVHETQSPGLISLLLENKQ